MSLAVLLLLSCAALPEPGELQARVDSMLAAAADGARLDIDHSALGEAVPPPGADGWELARRGRGVPGGSESFVIQWLKEGRPLSKRTLVLRVRRFETVATACADLPKGRTVLAEDLCPKEMAGLGLGARAVRAGAAVGWTLRHPVQAGHVFVAGDLQEPPLALKGMAVKVLVEVGAARVEIGGTLLEDAYPDRPVSVRSALGKDVRGRMDEPGVVTVRAGLPQEPVRKGRI